MTTVAKRKQHRSPALPPASAPVNALKFVVLLVACAVVIVPFLTVVSTSFADQKQITDAGGFVLWPDNPQLTAYEAILAGGVVTRAMFVSVGITVVGTLLSLTSTACLAYALSRPGSYAHRPMLMVVLLSLLFAPGMIPTYLTVKAFGMLNSWWALILPTLVSGFSVIVMRAFFMNLPQDLLDSAKIDGANEVQVLRWMVLPLSKAVIAVIGLFYAVGYWNAWFNSLLYIDDAEKWPLTMVLRTYVVNDTSLGQADLDMTGTLPPAQSLQMAILMLSLVPIVLVYPFLQRHFAKGVLIGAVKG